MITCEAAAELLKAYRFAGNLSRSEHECMIQHFTVDCKNCEHKPHWLMKGES